MTRVLVCGGRNFKDRQVLFDALDMYHGIKPFTCVITGGATGADRLALDWAELRGVPYDVYYADWNTYGKSAGPIRNAQMLEQGMPDQVIAFPGGKGTKNMTTIAIKKGVPVCFYTERKI